MRNYELETLAWKQKYLQEAENNVILAAQIHELQIELRQLKGDEEDGQ